MEDEEEGLDEREEAKDGEEEEDAAAEIALDELAERDGDAQLVAAAAPPAAASSRGNKRKGKAPSRFLGNCEPAAAAAAGPGPLLAPPPPLEAEMRSSVRRILGAGLGDEEGHQDDRQVSDELFDSLLATARGEIGGAGADALRSTAVHASLAAIAALIAEAVEALARDWSRSALPRLEARSKAHWKEARRGEADSSDCLLFAMSRGHLK